MALPDVPCPDPTWSVAGLSAGKVYYSCSQLFIYPMTHMHCRAILPAGGAEGTRTPGLYSAIVALSQLSYSPEQQPSL